MDFPLILTWLRQHLSVDQRSQCADGDVRNDIEYLEWGSRFVRRVVVQRETSIWRV